MVRSEPKVALKHRIGGWFGAKWAIRQVRRADNNREIETMAKTWFMKSRELLAYIVGGLIMLASLLAMSDWTPYLDGLKSAIEEGDGGKVFAALGALVLFAAKYFARVAKEKRHKEMMAELREQTARLDAQSPSP